MLPKPYFLFQIAIILSQRCFQSYMLLQKTLKRWWRLKRKFFFTFFAIALYLAVIKVVRGDPKVLLKISYLSSSLDILGELMSILRTIQ